MRPKPENSEDCFDTACLLFYECYAPAFWKWKRKWFPISGILAYFLMLAHIGLYTLFLNIYYCATRKIKAFEFQWRCKAKLQLMLRILT